MIGRIREPSPGLLIKLMRLNVPCSSGGFLQFNRTISMCGKLEEFPESRRTLYFHSFANTTLSVVNHPKFHFVYKLVDHCYNVTLLERNSSFVIRPTHLALKCHFKIHLPFGNRVRLRLRLLDDIVDERNVSYQAINMSTGSADYRELSVDDFSSDVVTTGESTSCEAISIEIGNRHNERWSQCASAKNFAFEMTSTDNVLLIRITKRLEQNKGETSSRIGLEYSSVPIESIVSQCDFGWIMVGQFCLSTFGELLPWQAAESFCNELGGNLASIRNENEQQMIDEMVLNR